MNTSEHNRAASDLRNDRCLMRVVAKAMRDEPALGAVKIDRRQRSIAVATLGNPRSSRDLEEHLAIQIRQIEQSKSGPRCELLDGKNDCAVCLPPMVRSEAQKITLHQDADTTTLARVTCPTAPSFWRWRDTPWPKLVPREVLLPDEAEHDHEWQLQLIAAALCGAFGLMALAFGGGSFAIWAYLLAYVSGAWFTAHEVWERLHKGALDVHFLMLAVALGSASIGAWAEGATLLFLFSLSGALEHYAMGRTQREIRSLFKAAPKVATVLDARGSEQLRLVEELGPGLRLLIKPGEQFPVDAEVAKGSTASDESNLTGESVPVEKGVGDVVLAGTLNLWGVVEVVVLRTASQSALQKIIQLIREAQHLKAPSQRFTDQFGTRYTYAILGLTALMFFVWWLALGAPAFLSATETKSAFYRAMTLLVVASPCALVLSIPSAILAAIAWAARRGILFRGGAAVERLAEVSLVAMDKTGTLTTGELRVERIESFPAGREEEVARLAYSLERLSTHPLARAITRYGKQRQLPALDLQAFESVAGLGLRARLGEAEIVLGRREWLVEGGRMQLSAKPPTAEHGFSEVWLAKDGLAGRILLRDDLRIQARELIERLRKLGLRTVVLTGDRRSTADYLKAQLRLDEIRAELKPEQKVEVISAFLREGHRVAMIGDGVNDAPSLAAAHVGVAMGARGSDAALEQAEVVLMHDRLENFLAAFRLSQRARRIIRQNLLISLGTVVVLVSMALIGKIPLTLGVVGHEGSTVVVVLNSLRLLFGGSRTG